MVKKDLLTKISDITNKNNIPVSFYNNRYISGKLLNSRVLKHIYFHIVDQCNLNCAYCDNYAPLVQKDRFDDILEFEKLIKRTKELFTSIPFLVLGGGGSLCFTPIYSIYVKY